MQLIDTIIQEAKHSIDQFSEVELRQVESNISRKESSGKSTYYINCFVRNKPIKLTPEELVRQLYLLKLNQTYNYPFDRMQVEFPVNFGREVKRADIVIFDKIHKIAPYIIIELKKPKLKDGKEQLRSYCNATGAPIGVWTNGGQISYYHRKDPNYFEDIPNIPTASESLKDILSDR